MEISQTEVADSIHTRNLFQNRNVNFTVYCSYMLSQFSKLTKVVLAYVENSSNVKESETYQRFREIDIEAKKIIARIKEGNADSRELRNYLGNHAEFVEIFDPKLAKLILNYAPMKEITEKINISVKDIEQNSLNARNLTSLTANTEMIQDQRVRVKVKAKLKMFENRFGELKLLQNHMNEIANWQRIFNGDLGYFVSRVEAFFQGYTNDHGLEIKGIDHYKDKKLRKIIFSSPEFRLLNLSSRFTYNIEGQLKYLSKLIDYIKLDIVDGRWEKNVHFSKFYTHIEKSADFFLKNFRNEIYAQSLINNRKKVGEDPFRWVEILEKMESGLVNSRSKLSTNLEHMITLLNQAFGNRSRELQLSLRAPLEDIKKLVADYDKGNFVDSVKKSMDIVEVRIMRLWRKSRKRLQKIKGETTTLTFYLFPKIERFSKEIGIEAEVSGIRDSTISLDKEGNSFAQTVNAVNPLEEEGYQQLPSLMLGAAIMESEAENINSHLESASYKSKLSEEYDLRTVNKRILRVLELFEEVIKIANHVGAQVNTQSYHQMINDFGVRYGLRNRKRVEVVHYA